MMHRRESTDCARTAERIVPVLAFHCAFLSNAAPRRQGTDSTEADRP